MVIFAPMKDRKLIASEMNRLRPEDYAGAAPSGIAVVLDNVRSAYNVGSVFRSADAFHVDRIALCGICALPPSAEIHKTALGAEDVVPWAHYAETLDAIAALRSEGYTIVAVEQTENSIKLAADRRFPSETRATLVCTPKIGEFSGTPDLVRGGTSQRSGEVGSSGCETVEEGSLLEAAKYAFVFGNEVDGVQQQVVDACDFSLEIPQRGTKHSLNVAVSAGIVLFAASK